MNKNQALEYKCQAIKQEIQALEFIISRQDLPQDVSIAHDMLTPDAHVLHAHTKNSSTRDIFNFSDSNMSSSNKEECSICECCFAAEDELVITECFHTFHRTCAQKRVDERKKTNCHICHKDSELGEALGRKSAAINKTCTICEEAWYPQEDLVMTSCYHVFHRACAQNRLDTRKKTNCRTCDKPSALGDALLRQVTSIEYRFTCYSHSSYV